MTQYSVAATEDSIAVLHERTIDLHKLASHHEQAATDAEARHQVAIADLMKQHEQTHRKAEHDHEVCPLLAVDLRHEVREQEGEGIGEDARRQRELRVDRRAEELDPDDVGEHQCDHEAGR